MNVTFDAERHLYYCENKLVQVSVTTMLRQMGMYGSWLEYAQPRHRQFGDAVHKAVVCWQRGKEYETQERVQKHVWGWYKFIQQTGFRPRLIEQPMTYGTVIGGSVDFWGEFPDGRNGVVDVKASMCKESAYAIQTAGYEFLIEKTFGYRTDVRMCVYLEEHDFEKEEHTDPRDRNRFLYTLDLWQWKKEHGRLQPVEKGRKRRGYGHAAATEE